MSDKIEIICPRCQHRWWQSLEELEWVETTYKQGESNNESAVEKYRARCPIDGTYVIVEVVEE